MIDQTYYFDTLRSNVMARDGPFLFFQLKFLKKNFEFRFLKKNGSQPIPLNFTARTIYLGLNLHSYDFQALIK